MELTKTKLNKILKKYKFKLEQHEKEWRETCHKIMKYNTPESMVLPSIYVHEEHNSKGAQLFKDLMKEFEGYEVFPKKQKRS